MHIHLTPDQESYIRTGIDAGRFADAETAMQEAFRLLRAEDEDYLAWLRAEVQIGIDDLDNGRVIHLTKDQLPDFFEDIKRRGKERLAQKGD